jgi:GNAT superfamily N-acetyltransferase
VLGQDVVGVYLNGSGIAVRDAGAADCSLLWDMLYEASFATVEPKPPRDAVRQPEISRYLSGWGRAGDRALVAEVAGRPVGAAWYRLFPSSDPGYGFVDEATPELSIAVVRGERGRGVGRALLEGLVRAAREDGFQALTLSVAESNAAALGLYERCGFRVVVPDDGAGGIKMRALVDSATVGEESSNG